MCGRAIWTGIATCVGGGVMTGFAGRSDSAIWTGVVTCIGGGVILLIYYYTDLCVNIRCKREFQSELLS